MNKETSRQLRENEAARKRLVQEATQAWRQVICTLTFGDNADRLADIDVSEARSQFDALVKHVHAARELRTQREELKAEL